jgi:hypothetical protein
MVRPLIDIVAPMNRADFLVRQKQALKTVKNKQVPLQYQTVYTCIYDVRRQDVVTSLHRNAQCSLQVFKKVSKARVLLIEGPPQDGVWRLSYSRHLYVNVEFSP